jgi:hypothetical protein
VLECSIFGHHSDCIVNVQQKWSCWCQRKPEPWF